MTYIVHVTAVVEGELHRVEALIDEYRYSCLQNQPGMDQFYVCRSLQEDNVSFCTPKYSKMPKHIKPI